jgi:RHS repeat-associated protein
MITTETGSQIKIAYENTTPTCSPGQTAGTNYPSNPAANTWSCFPVYWGTFTSPNPDWFYKYAVSSVQVTDPSGGSPGLLTSYQYAGPAWHYDDNEVVEAKDRTYGQWRGYQHVYTFNGTGNDPLTETGTIYYQGMSDDNNSTDVTVSDLTGQKHEDADQLAGDLLEQTAYDYASTTSPASPTVNNSTVSSYWVSAAAATRTRTGLPALTSNYTGVVENWAEQELTDSSPATYRITETDTSYQTTTSDADFGLPLYILNHGDVSQPAQATCATLTYAAPNTGANLTGLVSETEVDAAPCSGANPDGTSMPSASQVNDLGAPAGITKPADVISDTRTYYDNPPVLSGGLPAPGTATWPQAAPGNADVSVTEKATNYSGGAFSYLATGATAYDSYGRPVTVYDANGNKTTTSYVMANGSVTAQTVTNPLGQATTTTYDPARGLPVTITDPNNIVTTDQYDELGRLTSAWNNSRATTSSASATYSYSFGTATTPTVVTTKTLDDSSGYVTSTALYDALLRLRQTQYPTPQGGVLVTDNFYDSRGFTWKVNHDWWDSTASPGSSILTVLDSQVPDQTWTQFDGLGRPVIVTDYDDSAVRSVAYTQYTGDRVITVPAATGTSPITPVGATPTAVTTDGLGRTTEEDSYTSWPSVTTGTNTGGLPTVSVTGGATQATTYSYNTRGWLATTATGGQQWTSNYNLLGQVTSATSPNAGTTSMAYDNNGNLTQTTDQLGHPITTTYDALNRKTGEYDGSSDTAPPIATWTYDNSNSVSGVTDPIGQLTTENAYDQNGDEFSFQQTGFNAFGESLGETITVPSDQGVLAGKYTLSHTYTATTGLPWRDTYPASPAGASLPAETLTHTYIAGFDLPNGLTGLAAYAQATTYTAWSQVGREEIGSTTANAYVTNTYDANTGNLTDTQVANTAVSSTPYDDTSYTYDPGGNVTGEQDVRNGTQTELQCFAYTTLDQLTQAWTTNGSPACTSGPPAGGSTITDGITGGAYWTKWAYNSLGNQTTETDESVTGGTASTTTYNYANNSQPDTLTSSAGATTASYTYNTDGETLTRDIPSGNQTLTWTDDGKLSTDTVGSNKTTYIYDGEGDLLAADNPTSTTLYIFGEQLTATSSGSVSGIRFIPLPGGGQAVRTAAGSSYYFETSDLHGTSLLALASNAQSPVWRQFTPYGSSRGSATGSWPDTNGYLSDPVNANTGLTTIGARQYDPLTGRFLSSDPVFEADDPTQMGGYAYAADNPVTNVDATGLCASEPGHPCVTDNPDPPPAGSPGSGSSGDSSGDNCNSAIPGCPGYTGNTQVDSQANGAPEPKRVTLKPGNPAILGLPSDAFEGVVTAGWLGSLGTLNNYFNEQGAVANSRFTIVLSEVEVESADGPLLRLVAFVSKGGLPRSLQTQLADEGVTIYQADPFEGHAEIAAQNYRADTALQEQDLGGPISKVNAAVMNNGACSAECAQGLTNYIGRDGVNIQPGDQGYYEGQVLTPQYMSELQSEFGGASEFEAIIQDTLPMAGAAGEGDQP